MSIEISSVNQITAAVGAGASAVTENSVETEFSKVLQGSKTADLDAIFDEASKKYNISAELLKAVGKAESNFRADATSRCGAMGIMQLMPGTAASLGVADAYDPEQNIMGGAKYLRQMLDKFGDDVELALAGYNAGPGAVTKYDGIPPYKETQNYVKTVMGYFGGGEINAGTYTYNAAASDGTLNRSRAGRLRDSGTESAASESRLLMDSIAESFMLRMLELQMKSSDDEEKKVF